jgi:hypothetical protein
MTAKTTPDRCPSCGSDNLFSGHFDADDYAYPLNIGDHTPEGVRWTTFCNQCGSEVLPTTERVRSMTRASYRFGVAWIAENDEPISRDPDEIAGFISTLLLADLFGKEPLEVAKAIIRYRVKHKVAEDYQAGGTLAGV